MEPQSIAIVGGRGRMGSLLGRFLNEAGYGFTVVNRLDSPVACRTAGESDVTILAVPIPVLENVVRTLGPYTREDGVVIDIASVKARPVASMLKHCRGEVIGTHPLFGPAISTLEDQVVFLCPARGERWVGWLTSWLAEKGASVTEIDPEEHDRLMAEVQVLRHLLLVCFGRTLMKREFDLAANLPRSGRWFTTLVRMLERQLDQPAELYADIGIHNPASRDVVADLVESVVFTAALYASQDRAGLVEAINEVSNYLRSAREHKGE